MRKVISPLLVFLLLPLSVAAQVYTWKDASGKVHYSDQPPGDKGQPTRTIAPGSPTVEDSAQVRKQMADKRLDADQKTKDAKDVAAKAEKRRLEDEQRARDCERAKIDLQGIESGQIRFRMGANGEREALEDTSREAELANVRRVVEVNCSPRPAAKP